MFSDCYSIHIVTFINEFMFLFIFFYSMIVIIVIITARWGDGGYIKLAMDETTPTKWGQCSVYRAIAMAVTN